MPFLQHDHLFDIADRDAIRVLLQKFDVDEAKQKGQARLVKAVAHACDKLRGELNRQSPRLSEEEVAFYHGLLTGYAVALQV